MASSGGCFFEMAIGGVPKGRLVFSLDDAVAPRTCANFRALCRGTTISPVTRTRLAYKGSIAHRLIAGFMLQVRAPAAVAA